jgi:hypothetical protein
MTEWVQAQQMSPRHPLSQLLSRFCQLIVLPESIVPSQVAILLVTEPMIVLALSHSHQIDPKEGLHTLGNLKDS